MGVVVVVVGVEVNVLRCLVLHMAMAMSTILQLGVRLVAFTLRIFVRRAAVIVAVTPIVPSHTGVMLAIVVKDAILDGMFLNIPNVIIQTRFFRYF